MKSQSEFLFLLDRSGSMSGSRIEMAKSALLLFLKSLPPDCYFNIIGFGDKFEYLFPKSKKYEDSSLEKVKIVFWKKSYNFNFLKKGFRKN